MPIGASAPKWRAPKFMKINMVNDIVYTAMKVVEKLFMFVRKTGQRVANRFIVLLMQ